jgi:hypothetical protein
MISLLHRTTRSIICLSASGYIPRQSAFQTTPTGGPRLPQRCYRSAARRGAACRALSADGAAQFIAQGVTPWALGTFTRPSPTGATQSKGSPHPTTEPWLLSQGPHVPLPQRSRPAPLRPHQTNRQLIGAHLRFAARGCPISPRALILQRRRRGPNNSPGRKPGREPWVGKTPSPTSPEGATQERHNDVRVTIP